MPIALKAITYKVCNFALVKDGYRFITESMATISLHLDTIGSFGQPERLPPTETIDTQ